MAEDTPNSPPHEGAPGPSPKEAIWHAEDKDIHIKVIGSYGFRSGKEYLIIEGSGTKVPADQIEFIKNSAPDQSEAPSNELASPKEEFARKKALEFLNERQRQAVAAKEAGKKGNHDLKIAKYEALREAAQTGNFDQPVLIKDSSGQEIAAPTSVREFVSDLFEQLSKQAEELYSLVENGDETKRPQLDKTYDLFDQAEEALKALEVVSSKQTEGEGNGDSNDNESPTNGSSDSEESNNNNPWLDPRRIQELKPVYDSMVKQHKDVIVSKSGWPTSSQEADHLENIISTGVVNNLISRELARMEHHYEILNKKYPQAEGIKLTEPPSEETKSQMLGMLEKSWNELSQQSKQIDQEQKRSRYRFREGQEVQHVSGGKKGVWIVKSIRDNLPSGEIQVELYNKDDPSEQHFVPEERLKEEQDWKSIEEINDELERLKPYFNKDCKIKLPDGTVFEGHCQGYSSKYKGVYLGDPEGRRILKSDGESWIVPVNEFLSWQSLKTAEEIAKEHAHKLERIDKEVPEAERKFQLDQEVKIIRNHQVETGWKVDDFKKQDGKVIVRIIKDEESIEIEQELLANWQLVPDNYLPPDERSPDASATIGDNPPTANVPAATEGDKEEASLSWWEKTKHKYDKLSNSSKLAVGFLGIVAVSTLPGMVGASVFAIQHKRHYKKLAEGNGQEGVNRDNNDKRLGRTWNAIHGKWENLDLTYRAKTIIRLGALAARVTLEDAGALSKDAAKRFINIAEKGINSAIENSRRLNRANQEVINELRRLIDEDTKTLIELVKHYRERINDDED